MDAKKTGGPDMMKMLQMMLPYMDSSTKRMLSIMMKLRELQELMEVKEERSMQEEEVAEMKQPENQPSSEKQEIMSVFQQPPAMQEHSLTAKLQEGLTPEQQNMLTSLTGMLG